MQCANGTGCGTNLDCTSLNCTGGTCAAPTNCIAKELNAQGPNGCTLCAGGNADEVSKCKAYLLCFSLNGCNAATGKDAGGVDCISNSAVCGPTTLKMDLTPQSLAITTYKCACPTP
jgi:hypothetical protein